MSRVAWFSALVLGLLVWSVYWGIRIEKRLSGQLVSLARNKRGRGAAVAFGIQASALSGFLLLWLVGSLIGSIAGDPRWTAVMVVPAALVYGPLVIVAFLRPMAASLLSAVTFREQAPVGKLPVRLPGAVVQWPSSACYASWRLFGKRSCRDIRHICTRC